MGKVINKKLLISSALFLIYGALTFIGALNHEIWFDEAQAWNIARDNDIAGIVGMMKYEGHPPLWHFILYPFAHLGFSVDVIPLISWAFMTVTAALVLFVLPLSLPLKTAVVFSGGFIFTNSVVSRSYCLVPFLLCLIAIVYKNRRKRPVLFGLLVALLANTHVCFSGMVGILGIFMIAELIKEWKASSVKENLSRVAGLLISGTGVLMLVLPLLSSLSTNSVTAEMQLGLSQIIGSVVNSPFKVSLYGVSVSGENGIYASLACVAVQICMLGMLILLRRYRRAFIIQLTFLLIYIITGEVIFYTNANRAAIVLFSFVFVLCIAMGEKPAERKAEKIKTDTNIIGTLFSTLSKLDKNALKRYEALLTAVMLMTAPTAAIHLIRDYTEQFCPAKKAAEFIAAELPADAVYVTESDSLPQLSAYYPDIKLYSLQHGEFYTYTSHRVVDGELDYAETEKDLGEYENIYRINVVDMGEDMTPDENKLFVIREGMEWYANIDYIDISPYELS